MILPTLHLNGTSRDELMDAQVAALQAVQAALGKLHDAAPNARDYYPQGDGAFQLAVLEHTARVAHLVTVADELSAWLDGVFMLEGGR